MPDSRAQILQNIRRSLQTAHLPARPADVPAGLPSVAGRAASELAEQFAAELTALTGKFLTSPAAQAAELVARLVRERQSDRVLAWSAEQLPTPGLLEALRAAGLDIAAPDVPRAAGREAALADLEKITVGLTGADAAIADTGTLVLLSGAGRPRLAAMSVRAHIALITPEQLYPSLAAWLAARPDLAGQWRARSAGLFITGPSRTADIEMTLTVGVHGPAEVIAVLLQP